MHHVPTLILNPPKASAESGLCSFLLNHISSLPGFRPEVGESQKVEGFRLSPDLSASFGKGAREVDQPCFLWMQL